MIGRTLPGGYVILELVGIGGMGRVYRAEQTNLGRTVAVKIVHPHLVGEESAVARFITEARAASRLNHPHSVGVIDFGKTSDGQLYLVMEFLRGRDLARVAYEEGPLAFRRIIDVLRQTLAALDEAHHLGIIHRDLKPENIILEPMRAGGDFVKVVDFGLAKMRPEPQMPNITSPGIVCGTPEYMSPEQGRGDPLDARSDVYAVGVVLFQLLTGRLPFEADSPTQVVLMHLSKPPADPRKIAPERGIPEPLVRVTMQSLAKDPNDRYASADVFAKALGDALSEIEVPKPAAVTSASSASAVKCGVCGAMNAFAQKFCGECGSPISASLPPPPPGSVPARSEPTLNMPLSQRKISGETRLRFPLPLVGRDDDLAWLEQRRADARTALTAARIVGDAGMGKTRLMREFLLISAAAGDTVVVSGPDPTWAEVSYYALKKAIRALSGLGSSSPKISAAEWSNASPEARQGLGDLFRPDGHEVNARLSSDERRFAAAEALRWSLVRANERSKGRRVVLAFDDLHAVDGASRNAIADAIADAPLVPVLVLATHPPEFSPDWPSDLPAARILSGLPSNVVTKLLTSSGSSSSPSITGGRGILPFYVDQLARFQREGGAGAPSRLADLIALRVERLAPAARRLLQALAVVGDEARPPVLKALLGESTQLDDPTAVLKNAGMVEVDLETDALSSAHPLLREVVLATIPAGARRELHERAAGNYRAEGAPIEVRAMHELHAHNSFEALVLLERVSVQCASRGDVSGNIMALRRGLELARREFFRGELEDPMRAVLIFSRKLGEALAVAGALTDADGVLREALDMAGPNGPDRARVLGILAKVASGRARNQEAQAYLREALELASRAKADELVNSLEELKSALAS